MIDCLSSNRITRSSKDQRANIQTLRVGFVKLCNWIPQHLRRQRVPTLPLSLDSHSFFNLFHCDSNIYVNNLIYTKKVAQNKYFKAFIV